MLPQQLDLLTIIMGSIYKDYFLLLEQNWGGGGGEETKSVIRNEELGTS